VSHVSARITPGRPELPHAATNEQQNRGMIEAMNYRHHKLGHDGTQVMRRKPTTLPAAPTGHARWHPVTGPAGNTKQHTPADAM